LGVAHGSIHPIRRKSGIGGRAVGDNSDRRG
jgi:hypothetical protein